MIASDELDPVRVRQLRGALGFNQQQFGWLLGVGERSVVRLENGEAGDVEQSLVRLVRVLGEARVEDVEPLLRGLLTGGPDAEHERREALGLALGRVRALAGGAALRLKDLRVWRWVYWATGARADADETLRLAREDGVICRQLRDPTRPPRADSACDYPYLEQLRAGDQVLLCHDQVPQAWFELVAMPSAPRPVPSAVVRFVKSDSRLGERLAKARYRLFDGAEPGRKVSDFSCLAVKPIALAVEVPTPRGRGVRDTMTAFLARG
jgi:transcriptional regulator with XRE-family HTH domain